MKEAVSKALLVSISNDNEEAFRKLYDLLYLRICRFTGYFVKSTELKEEIVSDVFLSIWQSRHTLDKIDNFEAYVYTIARNRSLYYLKHKKTDFLETDATAIIEIIPENSPENEMISAELKLAIENAINELPERCRLVFLLAKEEGLKYREIAEILSISEKTVNAQIVTAIKKLGESLRKYLYFFLL